MNKITFIKVVSRLISSSDLQILLSTLPISSAADVTLFLGSHFGWASLEAAVTGVLERACTPSKLALCFDLLLQIAPSAGNAADVTPGKQDSDRALASPEADEPLKPRSPSDHVTPPSEPVDQVPLQADILHFPAREAAGEDVSDSGDGEGSARDRANICARIVPLLVARISKGSPPELFPYSAPTYFYLRDATTASAYARLLERFGADTWQAATARLVKQQIGFSFASVPEMLFQLVGTESQSSPQAEPGAPGWMSPGGIILSQYLASAFVAELLADPPTSQTSGYACYGYTPNEDRPSSFVTASLKALHCLAVEASVLDRVAAHFVTNPTSYSIDDALLPAVEQLSDWLGKAALHTSWFVTLWRAGVNALEARTAARPAEPPTWALPATCRCACGQCRQLVELCRDPARTTLQLRVAKHVKKHVENSIRR